MTNIVRGLCAHHTEDIINKCLAATHLPAYFFFFEYVIILVMLYCSVVMASIRSVGTAAVELWLPYAQ